MAHPLKYAFKNLRNRAKERGHDFHLTFQQYEQLAINTGYAQWRGKDGESFSLDRADRRKGYTIDNVRVITLAANSRKQYLQIAGVDIDAEIARIEAEISAEDCDPF